MPLDAIAEDVAAYQADILVAGTLWQSGRRATAWCEGTFLARLRADGTEVWRQIVPVCSYTPAAIARVGDRIVLVHDTDRPVAWLGSVIGGGRHDRRRVLAFAFGADGTPVWGRDLGQGQFGRVAESGEGTLMVSFSAEGAGACNGGAYPGPSLALCTLDDKGNLPWTTSAAVPPLASPDPAVFEGDLLLAESDTKAGWVLRRRDPQGGPVRDVASGQGAYPTAYVAGKRVVVQTMGDTTRDWLWLDTSGRVVGEAHSAMSTEGELRVVPLPGGDVLEATTSLVSSCTSVIQPGSVVPPRCVDGNRVPLALNADGTLWFGVDSDSPVTGAIPLGGAGYLLKAAVP